MDERDCVSPKSHNQTTRNVLASFRRLTESTDSPSILRVDSRIRWQQSQKPTNKYASDTLMSESPVVGNVSNLNISTYSRKKGDRGFSMTSIPYESFVTNDTTRDLTSNTYYDEDQGLEVAANLHTQFTENFELHPSRHQTFDLVSKYEAACEDAINELGSIMKNALPGTKKVARTATLYDLLWKERCTWTLIHSLYYDRLQSDAMDADNESMLLDTVGQRRSEKQIVNNFYQRDAQIRQSQLVVDWLEKNAGLKLDEEYMERVEYFSSQAVAWENTLHHLQSRPTNGKTLVTEMDPDAPFRQKRPLDDLDEEDDARLLKCILSYVRAGQLDKAQSLCIKIGQPWRAATLEGWRLYHDPNYASSGLADVKPVEGNPCRDIWKSCCWRLAEEEQYSIHEKALYAALSGNLRALLPACISWEDYLWAYFRTMVDVRVEHELRMNIVPDRNLEDLPSQYWDKNFTPAVIFQELHASQNKIIQKEANHPFHIVQKYVILDNIDGLIEEMYEWVSQDSRPSNQLVRFMAHAVLFFRTVGVNRREEIANKIIETYVKNLIEERQINLVATYTATLPQEQQVHWYARFLEDINDHAERQLCLQLAEKSSLNVPEITKLVVENIRRRTDDALPDISATSDLQVETTAEDLKKIDAIDWLMFNPMQRAEALRQTNALMRVFLATKKLEAARAVFNKVPPDSISIIIKFCEIETSSRELSPEDDNASREYMCTHAYLQALESFNDWFDHYHHSKPELPPLSATASFPERVAYEHMEKQYESEMDRWKHTLRHQTKTTVERLQNVLLFVDGGWMVDKYPDASDAARTIQLQRLRELCLPQVSFLLHNILHGTEQYQACVQLADVIASEQHQLYVVFHKGELEKLLGRLRESALCLLNRNLDPLGYLIK